MVENKISKAITVYVNGSCCNLQCSYCYYRNSNPSENPVFAKLDYSLDTMIRAFAPERLGGLAEITVIGSAETLLTEQVIPFVHGLLGYGHVVTVVTNATLTERINKLIDCSEECRKNLIIKCSFHYRELQKKQLLGVYFSNINKVVDAGVSTYPFVVICPDYVSELDVIGKLFEENLGIKAHCSPCLDIKNSFDLRFGVSFNPSPEDELLTTLDKYFDTRIFKECVKYKEIDVQNTFCYAGCWSIGIDFVTGAQTKCHGYPSDTHSFYCDVDIPYKWGEPIAMSCAIESCALQYNFFSEGMLPDYPCDYTYGQLIYQPRFISEYIRDKLDVRFNRIYDRLPKEEENQIILQNKNIQIQRLIDELRENPFTNPIIKEKVNQGKKIAIYGVGKIFENYRQTIDFPVECYLDSFADGKKMIDGKKILKPSELVEHIDDYFVIVCVKNKQPLFDNLIEIGFEKQMFC